MAHFTMEFGEVLEAENGKVIFAYEDDNQHTMVVGGAFAKVFEKYPIFDEDYRDRLNGLIIDRYYNQEIGHETIGKFRLQFRSKLNEIMPSYNKLYLAAQKEIDPFKTMDIRSLSNNSGTQEQHTSGSSESNSTSRTGSRQVNSDLPQTMLAGNEDYASSAADANSNTTAEGTATEVGTGSTETTGEAENVTTGYNGSPAELLLLFIESTRNIDTMLLDELQPLFMTLFMNSDTFTSTEGNYYAI